MFSSTFRHFKYVGKQPQPCHCLMKTLWFSHSDYTTIHIMYLFMCCYLKNTFQALKFFLLSLFFHDEKLSCPPSFFYIRKVQHSYSLAFTIKIPQVLSLFIAKCRPSLIFLHVQYLFLELWYTVIYTSHIQIWPCECLFKHLKFNLTRSRRIF